MKPDLFTKAGATFSEDAVYRYELWRHWGRGKALCFIMLNPSTADENENDPTVERCERRAVDMGFGGLVVVNLFAFIATNPNDMIGRSDPVGPFNDHYILAAARKAGRVICAWGTLGAGRGRDKAVLKMLAEAEIPFYHLGLTANGQPQHPLYVPYSQKPIPWENPL